MVYDIVLPRFTHIHGGYVRYVLAVSADSEAPDPIKNAPTTALNANAMATRTRTPEGIIAQRMVVQLVKLIMFMGINPSNLLGR